MEEKPSQENEHPLEEPAAPSSTANKVIGVGQLQAGHILVNDQGVRARADRILRDGDRFQVQVTGEQGQHGTNNADYDKIFTVEPSHYPPQPASEPDGPDMATLIHVSGTPNGTGISFK